VTSSNPNHHPKPSANTITGNFQSKVGLLEENMQEEKKKQMIESEN
jgi:hypothetical protein